MAETYGVVQSGAYAYNVHSQAFYSPVTSGNLLIVCFKSNSSVASVGISDTIGTSYTLLTQLEGGSVNLALWYGVAHTSGVNTVTISSYPNNYDGMMMVEMTGTTGVLDTWISNYSTSNIPYNSFPPTSKITPNVTTNDSVINYGTAVSSSTPFPTSFNQQVRTRWVGSFVAPLTGTYTMGFNVSDAASLNIGGSVNSQRFVVGGTTVVSCAGRGGGANSSLAYNYNGTIALTGGSTYSLILDYAVGTNNPEIQLIWTPPGGSIQLIPSSVWVGGTIQGQWWQEQYSWPFNNVLTTTTTQSDLLLVFGCSNGNASVGDRWTSEFTFFSNYTNSDTYFIAAAPKPTAGVHSCFLETAQGSGSTAAIMVAFPSTVGSNEIYIPAVSGYAVLTKPLNSLVISEVAGYAVLEKPAARISISSVAGYAVLVTAGSEVVGGVQLLTGLPGGSIGVPYNITIGTTAGSSPFTFQILSGGIPSGLTLNGSTGVISGTPTANGIYQFKLLVTDVNGNSGSESFQITISSSSGTGGGNYGFSY